MNTVNVHWILFGKPYKIAYIFLSRKNLWQKSQVLLLIDKLKIPSQTVIGKLSLPTFGKGFRKTSTIVIVFLDRLQGNSGVTNKLVWTDCNDIISAN